MSQFNESQFDTKFRNLTHLVPWHWVLTPTNPNITCPSSSSILGTFAAENAVMLFIPLVLSNSFLMRKLTCGKLGGTDEDSKSWAYSWVFPFALQLGGNALIAFLMRSTPGYLATFSNGDLVMLYTVRPRLNWLFLCMICSIPEYWNSFAASILVEFLLQCMAVYYTAWTLHFANSHGYLKQCGKDQFCNPDIFRHGAGTLYIGAVLYITFFSLFSLVALYHIGALISLDTPDEYELKDFRYLGLGLGFPFILNWVSSWVFWAGFVQVTGDLYCPPSLLHQGLVWAGFGAAGHILGVGF